MPGTDVLGEFEQLVLLAVLRESGRAAHALGIRRAIEEATERGISRGALYRTLDRLEAKGLVNSRLEEPSHDRGGHVRKLFRVTSSGVEALRRSRQVFARISRGLEDVLGETS